MNGAGEALAALLVLAFFVQWITERLFGKWLSGLPMIYLSAAVGVGVCLLFQVDALDILKLPEPYWSPWSGQVFTGLIVGAGANALHDFISKTIPPKA